MILSDSPLCLPHLVLDRAHGMKVVSPASLLAFNFVHPVAVMLQCLALLLFKECDKRASKPVGDSSMGSY